MNRIRTMWASGLRGKVMLIIGGLLGICIICSALTTVLPRQTPTPTASQPGAQSGPTSAPAIAQAQPTQAPAAPTNTPPPPTAIPPTRTPVPPTNTVPPPTPNVGKVGERREAGGVAVTVNEVTKAQQGGIFKPEAGNIYLVLDVTVETTTRDKAPYNPNYFKVKDSDGFEYTITVATFEPSLKFGELAKGEKARGKVPFQIKQAAKDLVVTYEPLVILGNYQPIKIDLGQ